jgi:superfamily II DNA or RNA helicase
MTSNMELMPHQKRAVERNGKKELWNWSMRTGKTLPASIWSNHPCRNSNPYVLCLKKDKKPWIKAAPHATVLTKEEFKKVWQTIENPSCVVIDESHWAHGAVFTRQRSQQASDVYNFVRKWPEMDVLLTTATPVRNDPSSLHTALCLIGVYIPWKKWQEEMYILTYKPFLPRPAWMPRPDWRELCRPYLDKYADIVTLQDVVANLPPETHEIVEVPTEEYTYAEDDDQRWTTEHQHEQTDKAKHIIQLGDKARKLIIIAHYTKTIEDLAAKLSKSKPVFVLNGQTKKPDEVIEAAQKADDCYFIVQSSMASGFDGYMFDAMVFTAMSHKVVDYIQAIGRLHHTQYVKPAFYFYLIAVYKKGKSWDRNVYDSIKAGKDFYAPGTTKETES